MGISVYAACHDDVVSDVTLRVLEVADAAAWLAGEDDEQLRWFEMPAATLTRRRW